MPEKLLRPSAVPEVSESFRTLIWRINLGGLLTWISLLAGIFDLSFSSDTSLLPREGEMHSPYVVTEWFNFPQV